MIPFLVSAGVVALAEIGDKTQLLALLLACRFRQPVPIALGVLAATTLNHALAAAAGVWFVTFLQGPWVPWVLGLSFLAVAAWALVPDTLGEAEGRHGKGHGAFLTTLVCFFLVEIGDKTQVATVALAAQYQSVIVIAAGTTLGLMLANLPVIWAGDALADRLPLRWIRIAAAATFAALGLAVLTGWIGTAA